MRTSSLLLPALLLAGCATPPLDAGCERFGREGAVCLLPPAALPPLEAIHVVSVIRDGHEDSFIGNLHIDASALRLAGSSLFGTGLFSLQYDGHELRVQPEIKDFPAHELVVMLELALADPATLRPRLRDLDITVQETESGEVRNISEHGRLIAHIERGNGPLEKAPLRIEIPPLKLEVRMVDPVP